MLLSRLFMGLRTSGSGVVAPPLDGILFSSLGAVAGDALVIPVGVKVLMDVSTPNLASITTEASTGPGVVPGTIANYGNTSVNITAGSIFCNGAFLFENGTAPYTGTLQITLNGTPWPGRTVGGFNPTTTANDNNGSQRAFLQGPGSIVRIRANRPAVHRTLLGDNVLATATVLPLAEAVFWKAGDVIAISPSDYVTGPFDPRRTEIRTVAADTNGAASVTITAGLGYARHGKMQYATDTGISYVPGPITTRPTSTTPTTFDERAAVMNLSSNVTISGAFDAHWTGVRFGAHYMVMGLTSETYLDGVRFERCGQGGTLGRYGGVHWHIPSINPTTGAILGSYTADKAVMKNCVVHVSSNRACSAHGVHGAVLQNNTAVDVLGHVWFVGEDHSEQFNTIDGNWAYFYNDPDWLGTSSPAVGGSWRIKVHDFAPAGLWVTNGRNNIVNNRCGDGPRGRWYAPAMNLGNQINGCDTDGFLDSTYAGGCVGLSKRVAIHPFYTTIENWDNNTCHSCWDVNALAREIVKDEYGNTRQGKVMSTSNNYPCPNYDSPTQIVSHFKGERLWKGLGGAGYKNQVAKPLYDRWTVSNCPGEGFFGTTDSGTGENILTAAKTLNHTSLPAGVPDMFNAFATYHGTLPFFNFWAFNYTGTPLMYQGESVDLSLRCSSVFSSFDLYLDPVERYFTGVGYSAVNSIIMYRSPPPTIYQDGGYSTWVGAASVGRDIGGGFIQWAPYSKVGAIYDPTGGLVGNPALAGQYFVLDHPYLTTGMTKTAHASPSFLKTASVAAPYYGMRWLGTDSNRGAADGTHNRWQQVNKADNTPIAGAVWDLPSQWNYGGIGGINEYPHGYAPGTGGQDTSQPSPTHHHACVARGQRVRTTVPNASILPFSQYVRIQLFNVQRTIAGGATSDDYIEFVIQWSGSVAPALYYGPNTRDVTSSNPADFFWNPDTINAAGHSTNAFASLAAFNASTATGFWRDTGNNELTVRLNAASLWNYGEDMTYTRQFPIIIVPA